MGWKQINGRLYYYRTVRDGGRVRSKYLGSAESGALFAQLDSLDREEREVKRAEERAERERAEAEDRAVAEWFDQVEVLAQAALVAAGYHQHKRGEWRKRRERHDHPSPAEGPRDR